MQLLQIQQMADEGLKGRTKLVYEIIISTIVVYLLIMLDNSGKVTSITLPFFKNFIIDVSWFYLPFAVFVIVACSNAVNLTDGLDGSAHNNVEIIVVPIIIIPPIVGVPSFALWRFGS